MNEKEYERLCYSIKLYCVNIKKHRIYEDKYYSVLNSNAFKIGSALLQPFYFIKRILFHK